MLKMLKLITCVEINMFGPHGTTLFKLIFSASAFRYFTSIFKTLLSAIVKILLIESNKSNKNL